MLLHEVLETAAGLFAEKLVFDSSEESIQFDKFYEQVFFLAGALGRLGVKRGDRISILSPNCQSYIAYHYATAKVGAILHVLNTRHVLDEMVYSIQNAESSVLIIHKQFSGELEKLKEGCPSIKIVISVGTISNVNYSTEDLIQAGYPVDSSPSLDKRDPVLLIYTSGTTGRPKGALQTHEGSVMIDQLTADTFGVTESDVFLAFMPFFHQAGLLRTRAVLSRGGTILIPNKMTPEETARCIAEKKVSIAMLPPPYDIKLLQVADEENLSLSDFRLLVGGGGMGPSHAENIQIFCEKTGCRYIGVYGQTEVTGTAVAILDEDYFKRPFSCGKPLPGIDIQIWSDFKKQVMAGEIGEIMIRSNTCIPRYWDNQEASRDLYTGAWLHTGDLGKMDEEGFLYFMDRKKQLIKTGAENVYPREVENVLRRHSKVQDVVVLGIPDPDGWGEMVVAVLVLKRGKEMSLEELRSFCRGKIAGYKIPKQIKYINTIPRNFTGKPEKQALLKLFMDSVISDSKLFM